MSAEESPPARVEVLPAAAGQEPVLASLLELYAHDFSEFAELQLQPNGRFGYPGLSLYWTQEGRFPFLAWVDGQLAGFAMVMKGSSISADPRVWDMAEFFIARGWRRRGIGAAVAHEIWRRFPGPWQIRVLESNRAALPFWAAAVGAFTRSNAEGVLTQVWDKRWYVFSFQSPAG